MSKKSKLRAYNATLCIVLFCSISINIWLFISHGYGGNAIHSYFFGKGNKPLNVEEASKAETFSEAVVIEEGMEDSLGKQNLSNAIIFGTSSKNSAQPVAVSTAKYSRTTNSAPKKGAPVATSSFASDFGVNGSGGSMTWADFIQLPVRDVSHRAIALELRHHEQVSSSIIGQPLSPQHEPYICPADMVTKLAAPRLSQADFDWCRWAIARSGGDVVVGKSWGKLKKKSERLKFDSLNCNAVQHGKNPSCDDSWGDVHIKNWRSNKIAKYQCDTGMPSRVHCYGNDNSDIYCTLKNVQINFAAYKSVSRGPTRTKTKTFRNDFISTDCYSGSNSKLPQGFPFAHLYSPQTSSATCDYIHNGTVLMFSHDDIRNLGHTLNDIFNVWVMMWMDGLARGSHALDMLNIDSFKLGHNFDDQPNKFFLPYTKNLRSILKGVDFQDKTLCIQRVLLQPLPPRQLIWESWNSDMPCSFVGPSSLYQRWNLHIRHSYGLLTAAALKPTNSRLQVLLVVRQETTNPWGDARTSRNFLNLPEIKQGLQQMLEELGQELQVETKLVTHTLRDLPLIEQVALIDSSSILIGMHGAGFASSLHLPVGTKWCCGGIEMFPKGQFTPIRGHGNAARKMGIIYDRLDIPGNLGSSKGATVPVPALASALRSMVMKLVQQPTCVHPNAYYDPYLEHN